MKKPVSLALTLMLTLSLCACGGRETPEPDPTAEPTEELHIYTAEEGTLIREVWYNPNGLKFNTVIYEYDGFGEVVKELTFGINNAPVSYKEYTRDSDGRVSVMTSYVAEDAENYSEEYRVLYEYGETGLKLSETSKVGDTVASVTAYEYEDEKLVREKHYEGSSELIAEYAYEYDAAGAMISCTRQDYIEGGSTRDAYTYDAEGRLLGKISYDESGSVISRTEYTYDDRGNETKCSVYTSGGELVSSTKNEYSYDEPGNITKCVRTQTDGAQGTTIEYIWEYSKG